MRPLLVTVSFIALFLITSAPGSSTPQPEAGEELGPPVGSDAPGFTLETVGGDWISLVDYQDEAPVVLIFFRGEW